MFKVTLFPITYDPLAGEMYLVNPVLYDHEDDVGDLLPIWVLKISEHPYLTLD